MFNRLGFRAGERAGAAILFAGGLLLSWQGLQLSLGSLANFGPGLFPFVIGVVLAGLAGGLLLRPPEAPASREPREAVAWRSIVAVSAGMIAFALLILPLGLVPATVSLVVLSSLGERGPNLLVSLASAAVLSLVGVAIFIWGLGLPLHAIKW